MRASMAYFAGAGTVVVAIAVGLGGGFVIADVMNPQARKELSKVELQAKTQPSAQPSVAQPSPQPSPSPATASNAPQTPVPNVAQVQPAASASTAVGAAKSSDASAKRDDAPNMKQADQAPSQPATRDGASAPENAYAKAGDADPKRPDDKRKSSRRQSATRHQQQRDQDMRGVEEQVRRDSGPREFFVQRDDSDRPDYGRRNYDRPMRFDFPPMNFFGPDD